jgi:hypothetical protein
MRVAMDVKATCRATVDMPEASLETSVCARLIFDLRGRQTGAMFLVPTFRSLGKRFFLHMNVCMYCLSYKKLGPQRCEYVEHIFA